MTTFFALLALAANVATLLLAVAAAGGRSEAGRRFRSEVLALFAGWELWTAFIVATSATLGSLYLSEIAHFVPCQFCWYQRIAMYPLAVMLGIAAWRHDHGVRIYVSVIAAIGAGLSTYHYLIQRFPDLDSGSCSLGVPCTTAYVMKFGFMTIPYMAFSGFTLILALMWADRCGSREATPSFTPTSDRKDEQR